MIGAPPRFGLLIRRALVFDGEGGPGFEADIAINGDTIEAIGEISADQAAHTLQADGLAVSPGFIDIHTHSDGMVFGYPLAESRVYQGITTEIAGNCGMSAAPLFGARAAARRLRWLEEEGIGAGWNGLDSYLSALEREGISVNQGMLIGHGSLRKNTAGEEWRPLSPDELRAMERETETAMECGAFGISTGLEYAPGRWSPPEEIAALARIAAKHGGLYASHIRNEQEGLIEAIAEALDIGRRADIPVQISHLKACGRPNWDKQEAAIHAIEDARTGGVDVMADAYPYTAYATELSILLEPWARAGGTVAALARLADPATFQRIADELEERIARSPGDPSLIVIGRVETDRNRPLTGANLQEIASEWKMPSGAAAARLLLEERLSVGFIGHGMAEDNVGRALAHPLTMAGSDGYCQGPHGRAAKAKPHPRSYGTFPRLLGRYARDLGLMTLGEAVRKATSMPADRLGIKDRGRVCPGCKADLVVFDPQTIADTATFENPHSYPTGIHHVIVNGEPVIRKGAHTGARPGRALRKPPR